MEVFEMKKCIVSVVSVIILTLFAGQANALVLTQNEFITAESLDSGMTQAGVFVSVDRHFNSFYPAFRYGLGALFEIGGKLGVVTNIGSDDKVGGLVALDLKYQLIKQTEGIPIDMAVDLGFDTAIISRKNVSELKFTTLFSRGFTLTDRGYKFTPYAGLQVSSLFGSFNNEDQTNFYALGGLEWKFSRNFMVLVEAKGGRTLVGGAGLRFEF
jgi:hypothetical protein